MASWSDVRDTVEGDGAAPAGIAATEAVLEGVARPCAPCGPGEPQTSQYPSTIVPEQPGWLHRDDAPAAEAVADPVESAAPPDAGPGDPQTSQ